MLRIPVRLIGAFALAFAPGWVLAQATAPITAVTVYPGSATVVRTVRIEGGATRVVIPEVTTQFATESLRVDADPGIRIGQIVTQDTSRTESAYAAQAAIEARIQALKDQAEALDVQAGAADIVKGYLERTGTVDDRPKSPADAKALTAVVAAISQAAAEALGKKQQVAMQKREIEKKIAALQRDLGRARTDSRDTRTVTIQLAAERAGALRVSYQVDSAGWRPAYRAELDASKSKVGVERLAQVSQKTGEDWRGVKLSLSTTQPRQLAFPVAPQPWLLTYYPPIANALERGDFIAAQNQLAAAPAPAAAPMAKLAQDGYQPPTFQTDSTFATEFAVPNLVTLGADGREVSITLARETLSAKQRVQVTPRQSTVPVVVAEVERPSGVWPAGNLQLYRDGNYVGAMRWSPQADEKWDLAFGRDDLLQVRVDPLKGDAASTGIFGKRNVRQIADRITLHSSHRTPIDLVVIAPTPVSTSEEITVKAVFEPKPTIPTWKQNRGVVAWERSIAPQQTWAIELGYTIEYPKEGSVDGLR
jgi:uncharacterized protein (TIGR02231 family)